MQDSQPRTVAHEIVRKMSPELIHELAELEKRGLLEDTLKRALDRALLSRAAPRLLAKVIRTNLAPLAEAMTQVNTLHVE
jgi:hypothetical protein